MDMEPSSTGLIKRAIIDGYARIDDRTNQKSHDLWTL